MNVGVAEANLAGVAAGLALSGLTPFIYSIANFPTLRCLEQIRNDICYNGANVKIVAVGAGYAYGSLGSTHHATEDLAIMRALPHMRVVAPADPIETERATRAAATSEGPLYLRLGRSGDPAVHAAAPSFEIGKAIQIRDGTDVALIAIGGMVHSALQAADRLAARGVSARVISMHTLKPIDAPTVVAAARNIGAVVTIEEHSLIGGLGSAVAEVLADAGVAPRVFRRIALPDRFADQVGSRDYLVSAVGLSPDGIAQTVVEALETRH